MNMTEAIAKRMNDLAYEHRMTLHQVIKKGKINQSTISEIINGRSKHPRISTIYKFCKGLGITLSEFFDSDIFEDVEEIDTKKPAAAEILDFAAKIPKPK